VTLCLYARASFYGICIRQDFDFWRFHTPTSNHNKFGLFGKFSGICYAKTPTNASPGHMVSHVCVAGRGILRNAESCQGVVCGKFNADFFCRMKGKVRNERLRNVAEMNIY